MVSPVLFNSLEGESPNTKVFEAIVKTCIRAACANKIRLKQLNVF